jgi:hypothetical protein
VTLLGVNVSKSRPVTMLQARPHAVHFKTHSGFWRRTALRAYPVPLK